MIGFYRSERDNVGFELTLFRQRSIEAIASTPDRLTTSAIFVPELWQHGKEFQDTRVEFRKQRACRDRTMHCECDRE
jgi:hypothetical protein